MRKKLLTTLAAALLILPAQAQARLTVGFTYDGIEAGFVREAILPVDTVSVTIVGDVMMHQAQIDNCRSRYLRGLRRDGGGDGAETGRDDPSHYDFSPCLAGIGDILRGADICIANMEFTHAGPPYRGYPAFSAPESYSEYVADCGVDVFLMANNHILDGGPAGARRTLEVYRGMEGRGVVHTGCFADKRDFEHGYPLIVGCRGLRIALVNFTYGTNVEPSSDYPKVCLTDREEIAEALRRARDSADVVIALPHWGVEYSLTHSDPQEEVARFLLRHGADAVIGGHPHVVQDVASCDRFPDKTVPVVYSLGNIISNMSAPNTQIGLIVTLPVVRYSDGSARVGKPRYTLTWCSLPGGLNDCHATVPVGEYMGRRTEWRNPGDYDKMVAAYNRIKSTSGIEE